MGNIIVGIMVAGILGFTVFRLVRNSRKGKTACGCEKCSACAAREPADKGSGA
ncbi:MAG: FeoB-associated Cys-rich membrane protein [Treponema sp.]|jgi:hypothetical protein|nr:FeoB-associated Cys-rich membrane protein [Treponema sp.]